MRRWSRKLLVALPLCAAFAVAAGGASARSSNVMIQGLSKPVYQGQTIVIHVTVRPRADHCAGSITYKGGKIQRLPDRVVGPDGASWSFRIPAVPAGMARATLVCAEAGKGTTTFRVQHALQTPRIITERTGFTQRMDERLGSSSVSFGLQLRNDRAHVDATTLAVLVNLVDADNRVIASDHLRLARIPAGATVYTGDQISHMAMIPIARVEVVAVEAKSEPVQPATPPLISDILVAPSRGYVDKVYAQILNQSHLNIQGGEMGTAIVNAAGDIIGGARGIVHGPLSLGARELVGTSSQLNAIPQGSAAAALVSIVPRYPRQ